MIRQEIGGAGPSESTMHENPCPPSLGRPVDNVFWMPGRTDRPLSDPQYSDESYGSLSTASLHESRSASGVGANHTSICSLSLS